MKKKQKINKAVNPGEWILLGLTALFLCLLFAVRERPAPERAITVRTASNRAPSASAGSPGPGTANPSGDDSTSGTANPSGDDSASGTANLSGNDSASGSPESVSGSPDSVSGNAVSAGNTGGPGETPVVPAAQSQTPAAPVTPSGDSAASLSDGAQGLVNLNTADAQSLCALPGIGDALAGRIIDYREEHGPFARPEDVMRVAGIGQGKFEAMKALITV